MRIPKKFECQEYLNNPLYNTGDFYVKFVTVLERFKHHYTGEKHYRVRFEFDHFMGVGVIVEYATLNERQMQKLLSKRVR